MRHMSGLLLFMHQKSAAVQLSDICWSGNVTCLHVQQIAGLVLVVACLLNAPPSFLEFLLCVPWRHLGELYPR